MEEEEKDDLEARLAALRMWIIIYDTQIIY